MKRDSCFLRMKCILLAIIILWATVSQAQERSTILAGHGTLSGSILPLWVGAEAKLFEKHGLQVKPIYLPRAAGRPALLTGDIQIYFSAGPPLVQARLSGGDIAITSCVSHKLTSKVMVIPGIQKVGPARQGIGRGQPWVRQRFCCEAVHRPRGHEARPGHFAHL